MVGARVFNHVELIERFIAVDINVEQSAGFTAAGCVSFPIERFREVQAQFIRAGSERYVIAERAFPAGLVELGLVRP